MVGWMEETLFINIVYVHSLTIRKKESVFTSFQEKNTNNDWKKVIFANDWKKINNDWKKVIFANDWKKINNDWKEIYAKNNY
jgi:hypothetical protein